jgi:hypothetical protein
MKILINQERKKMMTNNLNIFDYKTAINVLADMQQAYLKLLNIALTHNFKLLENERISILTNMEEIIFCLCKKYNKSRLDVLNDIINNKNED